MAEGRIKNEWQQTASLMALMCNINRSKKNVTFTPNDFIPQRFRAKDPIIHDTEGGFRALKALCQKGWGKRPPKGK